ncbi:hypothetical protein GSI_08443 [Ganoderma sinense ZZ0214-1]|uniref:BTB domain-containing protein n=1 Tax=Ganoderma sinense ZZ0214-1 TaxID=1077348 RepID=A0A2G8S3Q9_9APHY|nr:hypothetical protein GSI_08443 [Ganoderma sinense ZZ0214-1]
MDPPVPPDPADPADVYPTVPLFSYDEGKQIYFQAHLLFSLNSLNPTERRLKFQLCSRLALPTYLPKPPQVLSDPFYTSYKWLTYLSRLQPRDSDADQNDSAPKRAKPAPGRSASPLGRDDDDTFWYHDGNIVVCVPGENTLFKLHRSRLESQCGYFKYMFDTRLVTMAGFFQGCPMYDTPRGVTAKAFKALLKAIETPLSALESPPSQSHTVSLLETAHTLFCNAVARLATNRLLELWDSSHVPTKACPGPYDDRSRSYTTTITTIRLAREYEIPGVLKRALNLLRAPLQRGLLGGVPRHDQAERQGQGAARGVPDAGAVRRLSGEWCCYGYSERGPNWRSAIVERGDLKCGAMDPLRHNLVEKRRAYLKDERWCEGCLRNKEDAWEAKRTERWGMLDQLFDL